MTKYSSNAFIVSAGMLLCTVVAVLGGLSAGISYEHLIEFPPQSTRLEHQPTSFFLVVCGLLLVAFCTVLAFERLLDIAEERLAVPRSVAPFPHWGFAAAALLLVSWVVSWGFANEQNVLRYFTFSGIWLGYIFLANALCVFWSGTAPVQRRPLNYFLLFPASALFWWSFEYINRLVENWSYVQMGDISPLGYVLLATVSFSTVLPAVFVTKELLELAANRLSLFQVKFPLPFLRDRSVWYTVLFGALITLLLLAYYPTELFPLVWLAPALAIPALQELAGRPHVYSELPDGDLRPVALWSAAGLACGFLWELWNYYSSPKWIYDVSYVDVFHIFEMPLLGYLGYIPFGWLCGTVIIGLCPDAREIAELAPLPSDPPKHVAIIMDGNGRWARARGLPRLQGHGAGIQRVRDVVNWSKQFGVRYLTLYAFSTENWLRPKAEVDGLFALMEQYLVAEQNKLEENDIRLRVVGDCSRLPQSLQALIAGSEEKTADCQSLDVILAISYGSRHEIEQAMRAAADSINAGRLPPEQVDSLEFRSFLYAPDVPDPDLLIRTGGEQRLSNFLLWQAAYTELLFLPDHWPDFDQLVYRACLMDFFKRNRRYGALP